MKEFFTHKLNGLCAETNDLLLHLYLFLYESQKKGTLSLE